MRGLPRLGAIGIALLIGVWVSGGCQPSDAGGITKKERSIARGVFALSMQERMARFDQLNRKTQYAVYRYGMEKQEPPALYLAPRVAEGGEAVVELIRADLRDRRDDRQARDALIVLKWMKSSGTYKTAQDTALVTSLEERVDRLDGGRLRDWCRGMLEEIKK